MAAASAAVASRMTSSSMTALPRIAAECRARSRLHSPFSGKPARSGPTRPTTSPDIARLSPPLALRSGAASAASNQLRAGGGHQPCPPFASHWHGCRQASPEARLKHADRRLDATEPQLLGRATGEIDREATDSSTFAKASADRHSVQTDDCPAKSFENAVDRDEQRGTRRR